MTTRAEREAEKAAQARFDFWATIVVGLIVVAFIGMIAYFVLDGQKDAAWCEGHGGTYARIDGDFFCLDKFSTVEIER